MKNERLDVKTDVILDAVTKRQSKEAIIIAKIQEIRGIIKSVESGELKSITFKTKSIDLKIGSDSECFDNDLLIAFLERQLEPLVESLE